MADTDFTPELRSAKEKFLLYFHDLTACNRVCGARFFYAFNSFRLSGLNLHFPSFFHYRGILSRGVLTSGCLSRVSERVLVLSDLRCALLLTRRAFTRLKSAVVNTTANLFEPMNPSANRITILKTTGGLRYEPQSQCLRH